MAKPPGLRQRGNSWEMRLRVPKRLHSLLPTEKVKSLGSISFKDACRRGWEARAEIERQFEEAEFKLGLAAKRLLLPMASRFTDAELVDAARRYRPGNLRRAREPGDRQRHPLSQVLLLPDGPFGGAHASAPRSRGRHSAVESLKRLGAAIDEPSPSSKCRTGANSGSWARRSPDAGDRPRSPPTPLRSRNCPRKCDSPAAGVHLGSRTYI